MNAAHGDPSASQDAGAGACLATKRLPALKLDGAPKRRQ
jgi:hypothetical protein